MTKIIVYADFHVTGKRPIHRIDKFSNNLIAKLLEVYQIADDAAVDCALFLGDFFNNHRIFSYEILNDVMDIICDARVTTYAIIGQHDLVGYNEGSYASSTLNFMERHCCQLKTIRTPTDVGDAILYPCHCYDNFLQAFERPVSRKKKAILAAHHLITDSSKPFKTYLIQDFLPCNYSAVVFGDYHLGMKPSGDDKTLVWSPGALARLAINEKGRKVKVGILTAVPGKPVEVEEIELKSALSGEEVFGTSILEGVREQPEMVDASGFVQRIRELEAESTDVFDMIEKAAKQKGIRKEVIDYILKKRA